jgi:hypothetical protein
MEQLDQLSADAGNEQHGQQPQEPRMNLRAPGTSIQPAGDGVCERDRRGAGFVR